ncbi:hypothetical protein BC832DRAFT_546439 [Gaertneriomyces semiglobifer]|nr:hypothetical protein BC832DRAFT_546439 [Gaertneriomyces semiglobifer]
MADDKRKRLAVAICDYLNESVSSGVIKQEDAEGIEVAVQCIGEAFGVDTSDEKQVAEYSIKPVTLPKIFDIFLATQQKAGQPKPADKSTSAPVQNVDNKAKAEELKAAGNKKMTDKNYTEAISLYSQAIAFDGDNAIYYSNRAAAHTQAGDFQSAVSDAQKATDIDPKYSKAYSRLAQAQLCLNNYAEAKEAAEEGLRLEPGNAALKNTLASAEQKLRSESNPSNAAAPSGGARGGIPGMPAGMDFGAMLNNPNFMQMAASMMNNPAVGQMMQNPAFAQMAQQVMSDPNALQSILSDPSLAGAAGDMLKNGQFPPS